MTTVTPTSPITVLDYCHVVWRAKWWIALLTISATVFAFGVGRLAPKIYTARATILTPKETGPTPVSSSIGALLGAVGGGKEGGGPGGGFNIGGISVGMPSFTTTEDRFMALLRSRSLREEVVAEFSKSWGPGVGSMFVSMDTNTKEKGVIALTIEATDPKLAADLANFYFDEMDRNLQRTFERTQKRQEAFYLAQLDRAEKEVTAAEEELLKFQAANRTLVGESAAKAEGGASLRGSIMALEMQREVLRMRFTDEHSEMRQLQKQITELKKAYSQNLFGTAMELPPESPGVRGARKEFFVAAAKMTPVQFALAKLYRKWKIQEAFYTGAVQWLAQLKYQDGTPPVSVELLDPAIPPTSPSRPNLRFIAAAAAVSAFAIGVLLAFILEYLSRLRAEAQRAQAVMPGRLRRTDGGHDRVDLPDGGELARLLPSHSKVTGAHAPAPGRGVTVPGSPR